MSRWSYNTVICGNYQVHLIWADHSFRLVKSRAFQPSHQSHILPDNCLKIEFSGYSLVDILIYTHKQRLCHIEHIGLLLCQFFHHICKCFQLLRRCWTWWAWLLLISYAFGNRNTLQSQQRASHVVKCISSCGASDTLANFNRKVIYCKGVG